MKVDATSEINMKSRYNTGSSQGVMSFKNDIIKFKPYQITAKTPEINIPYEQILDGYAQYKLGITTGFTIVDRQSNSYIFSTMKARAIMKFLYNKF